MYAGCQKPILPSLPQSDSQCLGPVDSPTNPWFQDQSKGSCKVTYNAGDWLSPKFLFLHQRNQRLKGDLSAWCYAGAIQSTHSHFSHPYNTVCLGLCGTRGFSLTVRFQYSFSVCGVLKQLLVVFVRGSEVRNKLCYQLGDITLSNFLGILPNVISLFQNSIQDTTLHLAGMFSLGFSRLWQFVNFPYF